MILDSSAQRIRINLSIFFKPRMGEVALRSFYLSGADSLGASGYSTTVWSGTLVRGVHGPKSTFIRLGIKKYNLTSAFGLGRGVLFPNAAAATLPKLFFFLFFGVSRVDVTTRGFFYTTV